MKQKLKRPLMGFEPNFIKIIEETVERVRNLVSAMHSKMWEIGKVLDEEIKKVPEKLRRNELGQNSEYSFYEKIADKLENEITPQHLKSCVLFYRKYPDLQKRVEKTGLTSTHYERLSHLSEKEAEKFEKRAIEQKWTVKELRENAFERKIEIIQTESLEAYRDFSNSLTDMEDSLERLMKSKTEGVLNKAQIDGIARSLWIFIHSWLPKTVKWLDREGAVIDPDFKRYVKKVSG